MFRMTRFWIVLALVAVPAAFLAGRHTTEAREQATPVSAELQRIRTEYTLFNRELFNHDSVLTRRLLHFAGDLTRKVYALSGAEYRVENPPPETDPLLAVFPKQVVACDSLPGSRRAVIVTFGQSNATNEGGGRYTPQGPVFNYNFRDGKCYRAADPLLGTTGDGGNFATRLGEHLVSAGQFDSVLLAPVSLGGTFVHDWTPQGRAHWQLQEVLSRLTAAGLDPTHILWHQGEGDGGLHTTAENYKRRFAVVVDSIRRRGVAAPIYVATATLCGNDGLRPQIRAAQQAIPDGKTVLAGPDTDVLGMDHRRDLCHFNERGVKRHAELWFEVLSR